MQEYQEAKSAWEKALTLLPSDRMVLNNLMEFIYNNPNIPSKIREMSPFIQKFLQART